MINATYCEQSAQPSYGEAVSGLFEHLLHQINNEPLNEGERSLEEWVDLALSTATSRKDGAEILLNRLVDWSGVEVAAKQKANGDHTPQIAKTLEITGKIAGLLGKELEQKP
jgi:hypothetical protein